MTRRVAAALVVAVWVAAAAVEAWSPAGDEVPARAGPPRPEAIAAALLGPARGLVAGFLWVEVQRRWETREAAAVADGSLRVVRLVPDRDWYRIQAARMLAYDVPRWEAADSRVGETSLALARRLVEEGIAANPRRARYHLEAALLALGPLDDLEAAARHYRDAALADDAPPFAARLHGSLLERLGRVDEAHAWYRSLLAGGPGAERLDESARVEIARRLAPGRDELP